MCIVARSFAGGPETGNFSCAIDVGMNASHHVVTDRSYFNRLVDDISAGELERDFSDAGQHPLYALIPKVGKIKFQAIYTCLMLEPVSLLNLFYHRTRYNVSWPKLELTRSVLLHKPLPFVINEVASLAPCTFCYEYTRWQYAGRVELHEFHVL